MEFSRQKYWNGLPFPSPGNLPNPGIEPGSPAMQADFLPSEPPGEFNPITSWQIDGETMETGQTLFSWTPKITADGDCSHEIKRCLLLGRKAMTNLESILKSRDITLLTKVCLVKAMVFHIMYRCESWLNTKELMLLNCGVGGDSCEFLGGQGDQTSPS